MKATRLGDELERLLPDGSARYWSCGAYWALKAVESGPIVTPADEALAAILWEQDGTVCPVCRHHGYQPFTIEQILDYDEHECQWVDSARKVAALEEGQ